MGTKENLRYIVEGLTLCTAIALIFYENIVVTVVLIPFIYWYRKVRLKELKKQKKWRLNLEFKDGLQSMSAALNAGYAPEHAIIEAMKDLRLLYDEDAKIIKEFSYIANQIHMNISVEQAFFDFAGRSGIEDILNFSEVFATAKRMGGDLIKVIQITCQSIHDRVEVKREIITLIAAKRLESNMMKLIPAGIILYLKLTSPNYLAPFYHNAFGIIVMTLMLGVYLVAIFWIDKIMDLEL